MTTLKRVILGLGNKEFASGISYVACSHVKSYTGLAFDRSFAWERLEKINSARGILSIHAEFQRLNRLMGN